MVSTSRLLVEFNRPLVHSIKGRNQMRLLLVSLFASAVAFAQCSITTIQPSDAASSGPTVLNGNFSSLNSCKPGWPGTGVPNSTGSGVGNPVYGRNRRGQSRTTQRQRTTTSSVGVPANELPDAQSVYDGQCRDSDGTSGDAKQVLGWQLPPWRGCARKRPELHVGRIGRNSHRRERRDPTSTTGRKRYLCVLR